jgi:hypothetical protein
VSASGMLPPASGGSALKKAPSIGFQSARNRVGRPPVWLRSMWDLKSKLNPNSSERSYVTEKMKIRLASNFKRRHDITSPLEKVAERFGSRSPARLSQGIFRKN